ncbi:hypothetical protein FNF28_07475 [Cafeteria roenbergensis]|uniref:WW domain-containing protein n=1 Tax=Cafeteria roenbergensis TaxID=33653 RepID=A0A5A8C6B8_CAFRO|nr:hypothetical protein FNF28_07475 [Cafeteria roenbergensis]
MDELTVDPSGGADSGGASQFAMPYLSASALGSPGAAAYSRSGDPSPMRSTAGPLSASARAGAAARTDDGSAVPSPALRARRNRRRMFSTPMVAVAPTADPLLVEAARPPLPPTSADPGFRSTVLHTLRVPRADGAQDASLKAVAESARGLFRALDVSGALNLTDAGLRAVAMASPLLAELKLDGCEGVRGAGLAAVADCCPRLRTLGLARCSWVPGWVLARLGAGCPAIETLDLSGHDRLKDDDLRACVRGMTALTDVSLPLCTSLSDPGVLAVAQAAPGLRKLLLDRRDLPYKITDVACLGLAQHCTALETLSLVNCEKLSDSGLSWLAGACHSLTTLDLRGCTKVSDVGMRALAEGTPLLRRLRLAGCKRVGDVGVRHLAGGCPELAELDFGGLFLLSDGAQRGFAQEGLQALADAAPPIEALNLGGCTQVGDRVARRLPRAFPDLKRLALSACGGLTAPGLRDCLAGLPALTAVNLRSSREAVTDGVLAALASTARASLTSLCVADCSDVSDRGVSALARRCRSLQTLDMTGCKRLTDLSLFALADADLFPGLKDLSFRGCEGVTETGVSWLAMRSTTITRLELSGCAVSRTGLAAMSQAFAHAVRAWRGKAARVAMKLVRRARAAREKQLDDAARFVQRVWLGHRGRVEAARLARLVEVDALKRRSLFDWAAIQVQRRWRGELGRRRADAERETRARRWKQMWDDRVGRPFWYDKLTGEIRWRKPQEALNLEPKPHCSNCEEQVADVECKDCSEFFCQTCFAAVHGGGKRRHHAFRALNDYYGSRIDYGEGEWPALWPSEVRQDEFAGWMPRSEAAVGDAGVAGSAQEATRSAQELAAAGEAAAAAAAASVARGGRAVPAATHIQELSADADVRPAAAVVQGARTGGGLRSKSVREAANDGWTKVRDPATGAVAYFDVKTGVLSNDRPSFFVSPRAEGPDAGERKVGEDGLPVFEPPTSDFPVPPGPGKAVPEPGPGGWLKYVVAGEGGAAPSVYYYNAHTGDSTWDRPPEYSTPRLPADGSRPVEAGPPGSGWARFQDEASGASYYYNETSGESTWDRPAGFSTPRPAPGEAPTEVLPGWSWAKYWSEEHAADYWLDHATGESSWERPVGWGTPRVGDGYGVAPSEAAAWAQGGAQGYDGHAAAESLGYGAEASAQGYTVDASGYEGFDGTQAAGYGYEGYAAEGYAAGAADGYGASAGYGHYDQHGYDAADGAGYAASDAKAEPSWDA